MKLAALSVCLIILSLSSFGQSYAVENIPDSLVEGNDLVIREDLTEFTIKSANWGFEEVKVVKTLMNSKVEREARLVVGYSDLRKIEELSAKLYDENGKLIKTFKQRDFDDMAAYDGISIYSDNRLKVLKVASNNYPFTVELTYSRNIDGLLFYPSNSFNSTRGAVERSIFTVNVGNGLDLRYKCENIGEPGISEVGEYTTYLWEAYNQKRVKREPYGPPYQELLSKVVTGPKIFMFGEYSGDMSTWSGLGEFQRKLYSDLEDLPLEKKQHIRSLTADAESTREKIAIVYDYLQSNFRYVSVQLGVGGWRPFSPNFVDVNGYGDCKALSFYTKSLLETVDIESHYTLVTAGENFTPIDPSFPSPNFNHAILCVPNRGDTIWLECTSQTSPLGYNGTFTGGRDVFVITEDSAAVVQTKKYGLKDNLQYRKADVTLRLDGTAEIDVSTDYLGLQYENDNLNFILHYGKEKQKEWLLKNTDISDFEIVDFELSNFPAENPTANISAKLLARGIANSSGKRLFFNPNIMNRRSFVPTKLEDRKTDVILKMSYEDVDSVSFILPKNVAPEFLPEKVTLEEEFGSFSSEILNQEGTILYVRKIAVKEGRYSPETYETMRDFYSKIVKADKAKVVLLKET